MSDITSKHSEILKSRSKAPGHDRSFKHSEETFVDALRRLLPENDFIVESKPKDLKNMFDGRLGIQPDAKITHSPTNKVIFFEVKKQKGNGNAEERGFKTHTVQFQKVIREKLGLPYHPFVLIFCDELATNTRYTTKFEYYVEPYHYLLWKDYDADCLYNFLRRIITDWFSVTLPVERPNKDD